MIVTHRIYSSSSNFDINTNYKIGNKINLISNLDWSRVLVPEISDTKAKKFKLFEWVYKICFVMALIWFGIIFYPFIGRSINNLIWFDKGEIASAQDIGLDFDLTNTPSPTIEPALLPFKIEIPKIGVDDKVIANVDAKNSMIYSEALKSGVAHGLNSAFPGQGEMIYIFGHSTDFEWNVATYNAIFYKIKDLVAGDEIILHHGEKSYFYEVTEQKITEATDTQLINDMVDEDILVLQTCYPPGTDWKRLIVIAKPIRVEVNGKSGFELVINEN